MAKTLSPLWQMRAWGKVGESAVYQWCGSLGSGIFRREGSYTQLERYYEPFNRQTEAQQDNRSMFQSAVAAWQGLNASDWASWNYYQDERRRRPIMSGYNLFISKYLLSAGDPRIPPSGRRGDESGVGWSMPEKVFPVVEATNHSVEASNTTSHTVALPANIQAGETLLVFFCIDGQEWISFPEGWTVLYQEGYTIHIRFAVAWRKADGEEGASITVISGGVQQSAHISYRISGATDPTVTPPEASEKASGVSANPDPAGLTPVGGSKKYLWIAAAGSDDGLDLYTAYPTNYTNGETYQSAEDFQGVNIAVARRELETDSEDPGSFIIEDSEQWVACTVAVYPDEA